MLQTDRQFLGAHLKIDRPARAVHRLHVVEETGRSAPGRDHRIVVGRNHFGERIALHAPESVFAERFENLADALAAMLLDQRVHIQKRLAEPAGQSPPDRALAAPHVSYQKYQHAPKPLRGPPGRPSHNIRRTAALSGKMVCRRPQASAQNSSICRPLPFSSSPATSNSTVSPAT